MANNHPTIKVADVPFKTDIGSEEYWNRKFSEWEKRRGISLQNPNSPYARRNRKKN
jgi:hypothetical protein